MLDGDSLRTMMQMVIPLNGAFLAATGFEVPRQKHAGKFAASLCTVCLLSLHRHSRAG